MRQFCSLLVAAWSDVCLVSAHCSPQVWQGAPPQLARGWGRGASKSHFSWCQVPQWALEYKCYPQGLRPDARPSLAQALRLLLPQKNT